MKTVATHNGKFHADDVFAVVCVMMIEGKDNVRVVRTRDQSVIDQADWAVDVGGEYDRERLRFDHHQPGAPVRENGIDYAAFGLVWRHFGEQIAGSEEVAEKIEEKSVLAIDANDIGLKLYDLNELQVRPTELNDVIGSYLPPWQSDLDFDDQFIQAVDFAYDYLERVIVKYQAKQKMKLLADELYEAADDKAVIVSDVGLSAGEFIEYGDVDAIVMPDRVKPGYWVVSLVPVADGSFEYKKSYPDSWGGLRDEALEAASGIKGAVFCHKNHFLFVADSKEGALEATTHLK